MEKSPESNNFEFEISLNYCKMMKGDNADINIREVVLAGGLRCAVISVDGMSNQTLIENNIILAARRYAETSCMNKFDPSDGILQMLGISAFDEEKDIVKAYGSALAGDVLVLIEGAPCVYICGYRAPPSRGVGESPLEGNLRGPHESFTENVRTNTALIRRRITDPNLVMEHLTVGRRSSTTIVLCYLKDVARPELIDEVRDKINAIDIDIINDSGEIEQILESDVGADSLRRFAPPPSKREANSVPLFEGDVDEVDRGSPPLQSKQKKQSIYKLNLFPKVDGSEMPDLIARDICDGKVAIIVGGSPYVLVVPSTISGLMRVGEDEYVRWSVSSYVKLLRWFALIISVIGPALYVAIVAYHPGLLPTDLLIITAKNRANVPFSALAEVFILDISLELLREAAIRMPKGIGTSLSVVGGLIVGDSAIKSGLISPFLLIIVGLTSIAGFTIPSYSLSSSFRLIKYFLLIMSGLLGMLGMTIGTVLAVSAAVSAQSFGTDFTAPFTPFHKKDSIGALIELPIRLRTTRPEHLDPMDNIKFKV